MRQKCLTLFFWCLTNLPFDKTSHQSRAPENVQWNYLNPAHFSP